MPLYYVDVLIKIVGMRVVAEVLRRFGLPRRARRRFVLSFFLLGASLAAFSSDLETVNIKDIKNLKKNIDYTYYVIINNGKIKNTQINGSLGARAGQASNGVFFT
ncbi:MAG: hypothetical protein LBB09_03710, partial [Rickettsiales bacterium]|nr:hypothetical protein [Rickettsiales bacterium]